MREKHLLGPFNGFFMEIKKVEISMKNLEKGPTMCFTQVKKTSSKLYKILGMSVVLCPMFKTHRILFKTKIYEKKYKKSASSYLPI